MSLTRDFGYALLAWLILAVPGGIVAGILWFLTRRQPLCPPLRHRAVPWREMELMIAVLTMLVIPPAIYSLLLQTGLLNAIYGPDFSPVASVRAENPDQRLAVARHLLWTTAISTPLQIATILVVFRLVSGTAPCQLGLHFRGARSNLLAAILGWLVCTPLILALNFLVEVCFTWWHGKLPVPHDITQAIQQNTTPADWMLLLFSAVVAAPTYEELLFRGVLQGWLLRKPWGGEAALVGALLMALLSWDVHGPAPAIFVLVMVPGFYYAEVITWRWLPMLNLVRTIYGVALLFAAAHSSIWPTPIPLFFLGLVLGWLAFRTQSLVAPIAFHALFNAVACVQLALGVDQ